jgi:hypothetical protein
MNTISATVLSNKRVAGQTHSWRRIWENPEIKLLVAFSLVATLATLATVFMAANYPLVFEDLYAVL